jgi:hypothetical protein
MFEDSITCDDLIEMTIAHLITYELSLLAYVSSSLEVENSNRNSVKRIANARVGSTLTKITQI